MSKKLLKIAVIGAGVFLWSLATMACGLANSFASLFVSRAAVGVGEASLSPAAYSLIADKFPREQLGTAIAVYTLGPCVGNALAFTLGALAIAIASQIGTWGLPIVGSLQPWQTVCLIVGALTDFVFRDAARIGWSLGIVLTVAPTLALLAHRFALRAIKPMMARMEAEA